MDAFEFEKQLVFEEDTQEAQSSNRRRLFNSVLGIKDNDLMGIYSQTNSKKSRTSASHQVVCRHWLRGMCIKGEVCDFLHIFDPLRMPACRQFRKNGRCSEFEQGICPLRHEKDSGDKQYAANNNGQQGSSSHHGGELNRDNTREVRTEEKSEVICLQYLFGFCSSGPHCGLRHIRLRIEDRPCIPLPDWYLLGLVNQLSDLALYDGEQRKDVGNSWNDFSSQFVKMPLARRIEDILSPSQVTQGYSLFVRGFVIKSAKIENILTSIQRGIWATGKANIEKFEVAFKTCQHVIFLMSANESGGFQGYARMATRPDPNLYPRIWGSFSNKLSFNFRVQWLKQCKVDFETLACFTNPLNENKPLKKSRDGQELPLDLLEQICLRLHAAENQDLLLGTPLAKQRRIDHSTFYTLTDQQQRELEASLNLRP